MDQYNLTLECEEEEEEGEEVKGDDAQSFLSTSSSSSSRSSSSSAFASGFPPSSSSLSDPPVDELKQSDVVFKKKYKSKKSDGLFLDKQTSIKNQFFSTKSFQEGKKSIEKSSLNSRSSSNSSSQN